MKPRRPWGSVKALVAKAHAEGLTVKQLMAREGLSRFSVHYASRRMGITLAGVKPRKPLPHVA